MREDTWPWGEPKEMRGRASQLPGDVVATFHFACLEGRPRCWGFWYWSSSLPWGEAATHGSSIQSWGHCQGQGGENVPSSRDRGHWKGRGSTRRSTFPGPRSCTWRGMKDVKFFCLILAFPIQQPTTISPSGEGRNSVSWGFLPVKLLKCKMTTPSLVKDICFESYTSFSLAVSFSHRFLLLRTPPL